MEALTQSRKYSPPEEQYVDRVTIYKAEAGLMFSVDNIWYPGIYEDYGSIALALEEFDYRQLQSLKRLNSGKITRQMLKAHLEPEKALSRKTLQSFSMEEVEDLMKKYQYELKSVVRSMRGIYSLPREADLFLTELHKRWKGNKYLPG